MLPGEASLIEKSGQDSNRTGFSPYHISPLSKSGGSWKILLLLYRKLRQGEMNCQIIGIFCSEFVVSFQNPECFILPFCADTSGGGKINTAAFLGSQNFTEMRFISVSFSISPERWVWSLHALVFRSWVGNLFSANSYLNIYSTILGHSIQADGPQVADKKHSCLFHQIPKQVTWFHRPYAIQR